MSIRLKHRLEYGALRAVQGLVGRAPYRCALGIAWILAAIGFYLVRYRRAEAERRIRLVFPSHTPAQCRAIAWAAFRNFCFTAVESMRGDRIDAAWVKQHVVADSLRPVLEERRRAGQSAVFALPHMGSWEMAGAVCRTLGLRLFSIAARQKNPLFNDYLNRQRARSGLEILVRGEVSFKTILRNLKEGKYFTVLPDVRNPAPALQVPFLGGTANISPGTALFARQAGVPIYPGLPLRHGWTRHSLNLMEPIFPDPAAPRDEDLARMTRALFAQFDMAIRENPDQWFWFNKRWILDPVDSPSPPPES